MIDEEVLRQHLLQWHFYYFAPGGSDLSYKDFHDVLHNRWIEPKYAHYHPCVHPDSEEISNDPLSPTMDR